MAIKAIIDGVPHEILYVEVKNERTSNKKVSTDNPTVIELDFEGEYLLKQMIMEAIQDDNKNNPAD